MNYKSMMIDRKILVRIGQREKRKRERECKDIGVKMIEDSLSGY